MFGRPEHVFGWGDRREGQRDVLLVAGGAGAGYGVRTAPERELLGARATRAEGDGGVEGACASAGRPARLASIMSALLAQCIRV